MPSVKSLPLPYTSIEFVRKSKRTVPIRNSSKPFGEAATVSANIKRTRTYYQSEASYADKKTGISKAIVFINCRIPFLLQTNMTDISVYIPPFHNTSYFVCQLYVSIYRFIFFIARYDLSSKRYTRIFPYYQHLQTSVCR